MSFVQCIYGVLTHKVLYTHPFSGFRKVIHFYYGIINIQISRGGIPGRLPPLYETLVLQAVYMTVNVLYCGYAFQVHFW